MIYSTKLLYIVYWKVEKLSKINSLCLINYFWTL